MIGLGLIAASLIFSMITCVSLFSFTRTSRTYWQSNFFDKDGVLRYGGDSDLIEIGFHNWFPVGMAVHAIDLNSSGNTDYSLTISNELTGLSETILYSDGVMLWTQETLRPDIATLIGKVGGFRIRSRNNGPEDVEFALTITIYPDPIFTEMLTMMGFIIGIPGLVLVMIIAIFRRKNLD